MNTLALITGATSGIGQATAKIFAKSGFNLIITGRRKEKLEELASTLQQKYAIHITPLTFDIRDFDQAEKTWNSLSKEKQNIDILVNNAGLARGLTPIHEGDLTAWNEMIDTNIKGILHISKLVTPGMVERKRGHIVNICSTAGFDVYPNGNVYSATKFAVDALTKSMRLDLFKHNIRVSQVSPGHVEETEFALVRFSGDEVKSKIYEDFTPLNSKDVAEMIHFIVTRPKHVNIQNVLMMATQQAGSNFIDRSGRIDM
ncbi:MAG: SDR family NAD(P)-dependent oxidoreductase [Saprospiraceae bacterium]